MPIKVRFTSDFSNIAIENIDSDDDFDFIKNSISKFYLEPLKEDESKIWIRLMDFWLIYRKTFESVNYDIDKYLERLFANHGINLQFLEYGFDTNKSDDKTIDQEFLKNSGFKRPFLDTQIRDIKKMISSPNSANFSVPGAGKTTTLLGLNKLTGIAKLLIVVPNNEVMDSWEEEVSEMKAGSYKVVRIKSNIDLEKLLQKFDDNTLALVTYNRFLNRESVDAIIKILLKYEVHMVLDESHRIKGAIRKNSADVSKTGKNILSTSLFSKRRDILSGTPIPHSIYDIVSQFEFLYPNCGLGSEIKNSDVPGKKIQPLFTRTVKSELRLREITPHEAVRVPMSLTQAALYELIVNKYRAIYKQSNLKTLEKIQKAPIRQIWCSVDPHGLVTQVLSKGYDELNENLKPAEVKLFDEILDGGRVSNKMQEALNKAESILKKGEQVIIWSQFSNVIKTLSKELGEILNIDSELLTLYGETEDASKNIELFNKKNNEFKVLVANPKKGGEGISLHKNCWNAIYVDRSYDCAKYLQSRDRIHRVLGPNDIAPENVNYYIFESWHPREFDLIDRRISSNLKRKLEVMIEVLNDKELIPLSLGEDDIGELENAGLIGMEEINDYIDDLELEYENLKKNSILDEYLDSL